MDGEQVCACNVCKKGFDSDNKVKNHMKINHVDTLIEMNKNIEEDKEYIKSKALLERFDDDGNMIHKRSSWSSGTVLLPPEWCSRGEH